MSYQSDAVATFGISNAFNQGTTQDINSWASQYYARYQKEAKAQGLPTLTQAEFNDKLGVNGAGNDFNFEQAYTNLKSNLTNPTGGDLQGDLAKFQQEIGGLLAANKDTTAAIAAFKAKYPYEDTSYITAGIPDTTTTTNTANLARYNTQIQNYVAAGDMTSAQGVIDAATKAGISGVDLDTLKSELAPGTAAAAAKASVYKYDASTDPNVQKVQSEIDDIMKKGQPTFTAPTFDTSYVNKWNSYLQQIDQPNLDYATQQLNKTVNEQYDINNPYAVGSGTQVKASQDATNALLQSTLANRNATALALGQSAYQQDYGTAWNEYQLQESQLEAAEQQELGISQYQQNANQFTSQQQQQAALQGIQNQYGLTTGQNNFNYQNAQQSTQNAYQTATNQAQQGYSSQQQQQQQTWAQQIAAMYQPQQQPWYNYVLPGVGQAVGQVGTTAALSALLAPAKAATSTSNIPSYYSAMNTNPNLNVSGYGNFGQVPTYNYGQ